MHYVKTWISPFTTQQEDVVNIDDVYVSPRMVVEEKEHGNVGNTTKNGEVRETNNKLIERYRDLFHTNEKRNRKIFVVGDKGTGKSSFCKMMIQNWCSSITKRGDPGVKDINKMIQGEEYNRCDMSQFDFLFHISLCEMPHDIYDTDDMIKAQWNNYRNEVDDIFTNDSERILILVDGLDEWTPSKRKRQSLLGIPTSRFARDSTILTTSRPSSRGILNLKSSDYDLKVTLFGLRKSSVQPMIEKYMQVLNKTSAVKTLSDTLSSLAIKDIHNDPLLLQQIVWLYCKYHGTGQSRSSVYDHIMNTVREWECDKQGAFPTQQSSNLENFQLGKPFEKLASVQNNRQLLLPTVMKEGDWMSCIGNEDVNQAQKLLQAGVLPNAEELDKMCHTSVFRLNSDVTIQACTQICKDIQCKYDELVEDVWPGLPATEPKKNDDLELCTFIVVSNEDIDLSEIMYRCVKIPSKRNVGSYNKETYHTAFSPRQLNELKKVEKIIHEYEQTLMDKHKFLTMISASQYRCSGQTPNVNITDGFCIVLWVQYKGYVPIDEEPFKKQYGGVDVDVREGSFHPFTGAADEYQDYLKMGCKISGESEGNKTPKGTLGGLIEHPKYGYCGVTSAHCVLSPAEMKRLSCENGELKAEYPSFIHITDDEIAYRGDVYQPDQNGGKVGSLVKAVCHKGNEQTNNVGLDIAVFRLSDRFPRSAEFPVGKNVDTLNYTSGKTVGFPRPMASEEELIKFGMKTGLTRGKLESEIALLSVRQDLRWKHGRGQSKYRIHLNRQLEFSNINQQQFADFGDSGALVFSRGHNGQDLLCVGMVVGGKYDYTENKVSCVVTPITAILKELDVTGFKNFESGKLQSDVGEIRADVRDIKEMLTRRRWECDIS